tara:strand:+ start:2154 stop:3356 length:1203 start_codon:yes stop_codon:yes gene_type:complete
MIKKIQYLLQIFLLSPFLILILLIRPFVLIRFGNLGCERIGRIWNAELYLLLEKEKKENTNSFDIWITGYNVSNQQLLIILKRKFFTTSYLLTLYKVINQLSKWLTIYSKHIIRKNDYRYDSKNLFDKYPTQLNLTKHEINKGELNLKQFGIPKNAKIACITNRDGLYLKKTYPSEQFSNHDYRDSSIENYVPAIKALIKKNYYVVRMGKIAAKKVKISSKKFIDYPFHPARSDFMDFFFAYKCSFWIGGSTGIDELANIFRKPIAYLNLAPIAGMNIRMSMKKILIAPKTYTNSKNSKITLKKIFDYGISRSTNSADLKKKKIKLKELTKKQIKDIALEMEDLTKISWKMKNKKNVQLQKKFKNLYLKKIHEVNPNFHYGKFKSIYSPSLLRKNPWFLN